MSKILQFVRRYIPARFRSRRFMLDQYHFDLTSFDGDVSDWLSKFPISAQNVEIYFALAELFRRRGEFDKAVSVHEAIFSAEIEGHSQSELNIEIAQDYYAAGVLGHAEEVLVRSLEFASEEHSKQAFRLWLSILESEQDWRRAVELVEQYGVPGSGGLRLANLYCEYASKVHRRNPISEVQKILKKARKISVGSRANLMSAEMSTEENKIADAIQYYRDLLLKNPLRVNLVISQLKHLSLIDNSQVQLLAFLERLYRLHPSVRIIEVLLDLYELTGEVVPEYWNSVIEGQVREGYSYRLTKYWLSGNITIPENFILVLEPALKRQSLIESDVQVCTECGFQSDHMLWQCPQCEAWETLYSQYELKIEQQIKKVS